MVRFTMLLVAVALMAGTSGCTHCDTCDDFPTPCLDQVAAYGSPAGSMVVGDAGEMQTAAPISSGGTTTATPTGAGTTSTPPPAGGASPYGPGASLAPIPGSNARASRPTTGVTLGGTPRQSN